MNPAPRQPRAAARLTRRPGRIGASSLFTAFLMLACAALCWIVLRQRAQVAALDADLRTLTEQIGRTSLPVGEVLPPIDSFGASDEPLAQRLAPLAFDDGRGATIVYVFSGTCGACDATTPRLAALARQVADRGVRAVAVQMDARTPADLGPGAPGLPVRGVAGSDGTWLKRVPLLPSILVVDFAGTVRGAWYGAPIEAHWTQLGAALEQAAAGWPEPVRPAPR